MKGNVIVRQSDGPTVVVNSSLASAYRIATNRGAKKVYGMRFGIQGLLGELYIDLSGHIKNKLDIEILKRIPSVFLGTCRYKLPAIHENREVYIKLFEILNKLDTKCFIYIGDNDSIDIIKKLSDYAILAGQTQKLVGVPKTIGNDLALTDHTPGYGSVVRHIAISTEEAIRNGIGFSFNKQQVVVIEIADRDAGWLIGASALAKGEDCDGPDLIYLSEVPFGTEVLLSRTRDLLEKKNTVVVAIPGGIRFQDNTYVSEALENADYADVFGHKQPTGSATYLANVVSQEFGCKIRAVEFSTPQRSASHLVSRVDINEALMVDGTAVRAADEGGSGKMVAIGRVFDDPYQCATGIYDVHKITNGEKLVSRNWITEDSTCVTEDFIDYVKPLIQDNYPFVMANGIPRYPYMKE